VDDGGPAEWDALGESLRAAQLPAGTSLVLDFSETRHLHYRSAPRLLQIARELEERGVALCVTGLSDYLRRILEVACALEGRDFIERHGLGGAPPRGPADPRQVASPPSAWRAWDSHGLARPSAN
jgi:hypothetical protein